MRMKNVLLVLRRSAFDFHVQHHVAAITALHPSLFRKGRPLSLLVKDVKAVNVAAKYGQDISASLADRASGLPSLRVPLPGVDDPSFLPDFIPPAETIITTLPNGLRIGTQNSEEPCVSVGLLVDTGCIYEGSENSGVSHLLEKMAFHSTKNRSKSALEQEAQAVSMNLTVSACRDQMLYMGHGIKTFLPQIVEILIDSVRNAAFEEPEVNEQLSQIEEDLKHVGISEESLLLSHLHSVGYRGDYARSFFASHSSLQFLNSCSLRKYVDENFTASRMILSAVGVEHRTFLALAKPLLLDLPKLPTPLTPKAIYVGGVWKKSQKSPRTSIALAFEIPNGWQNERLANCLTVLKFLLGGGYSFSVGGPGKGMHTRFYTNVLRHHQIQIVNAFSSIYNHTGLFGVFISVDSDFASCALDLTCNELLSIITRGQVTDQELERAKNATISAVLMSLESKTSVVEDIACQIMSYGCRRKIADFVAEVERITLKDLQRAAREIYSTPLTLAAIGAVENLPSHREVEKRFRSKWNMWANSIRSYTPGLQMHTLQIF